jgi:hypothetical protein
MTSREPKQSLDITSRRSEAGQMESQPYSSQTPLCTVEHKPAARDLHRGRPQAIAVHATGNPEDSNHIACPNTAATDPAHREPLAEFDRPRAQVKKLSEGKQRRPKGLKQEPPRKVEPVPACPPHQSQDQHDVNRQRSTTPGPHENLL